MLVLRTKRSDCHEIGQWNNNTNLIYTFDGIGSASAPIVTRLGIFVEYTRYIDSMISSVGSPY